MPGALSAGGLRLVIAYLLTHRYVDCLVSTGANLPRFARDAQGRRHYVGSPHEDDALQKERIDRVYDTYASEQELRQRRVDRGLRDDAGTPAVHLARVPLSTAKTCGRRPTAFRRRRTRRRSDLLPGYC